MVMEAVVEAAVAEEGVMGMVVVVMAKESQCLLGEKRSLLPARRSFVREQSDWEGF